MQQSGDDPTAIQDYINVIQEAQKEGYTSLDDVATYVVIAGAQCEYQLGATPKHPPGFDNPVPAPAPATIPAIEQTDSLFPNDEGSARKRINEGCTVNRDTLRPRIFCSILLREVSLAD